MFALGNEEKVYIGMYVQYHSNETSHTRVYWLVHMCVCKQVSCYEWWNTRESYLVYTCYTKGCTHVYAGQVDTYVGTYMYATRVLSTCSKQSLRRIDVCSFA